MTKYLLFNILLINNLYFLINAKSSLIDPNLLISIYTISLNSVNNCDKKKDKKKISLPNHYELAIQFKSKKKYINSLIVYTGKNRQEAINADSLLRKYEYNSKLLFNDYIYFVFSTPDNNIFFEKRDIINFYIKLKTHFYKIRVIFMRNIQQGSQKF